MQIVLFYLDNTQLSMVVD